MGLLDTLQTVVQDEIGKQSSTVLGTVIAFYDGTCTVRTDEGTFENIKCANTPVLGSPCLLIPVNDEYISIPLKVAGGGGDLSAYVKKAEVDIVLMDNGYLKLKLDLEE